MDYVFNSLKDLRREVQAIRQSQFSRLSDKAEPIESVSMSTKERMIGGYPLMNSVDVFIERCNECRSRDHLQSRIKVMLDTMTSISQEQLLSELALRGRGDLAELIKLSEAADSAGAGIGDLRPDTVEA